MLYHTSDEVLQVLGHNRGATTGVVMRPETCVVANLDQMVKWIIAAGAPESEPPRGHKEEQCSNGEQVSRRATVARGLLSDLWRHVPRRADLTLQQAREVITAAVPCEAEICNLQIEAFVEEKILGLQVTVRDALKVTVVKAFQ